MELFITRLKIFSNIKLSLLLNCLGKLWLFCCISLTIFSVATQFHNYLQNDDVTRVDYKRFNERKNDFYPSIGFCLTLPFKKEKLIEYGQNITPEAYADFIIGKKWDEDMLKIDYDYVVQDLHEYIVQVAYSNVELEDIFVFDGIDEIMRSGYREFAFLTTKCVTLNIPFMKDQTISSFWFILDQSIFKEGKRLDDPSDFLFDENQFIVVPHYPNQWSGNIVTGMRRWPVRDENSAKNYFTEFNIRNVEILERRNTNENPCNEGFPDKDGQIKDFVLNNVGCKPPYWNSSSSVPLCTTSKQIKDAADLVKKVAFGFDRRGLHLNSLPCRTLEKIQYDAHDTDIHVFHLGVAKPGSKHFEEILERNQIDAKEYLKFLESHIHRNSSYLSLLFYFKEDTYKEIKHIREMDHQALIGI